MRLLICKTLCATFLVLLVILGAGNVDLVVSEAVAGGLVLTDNTLDAVFRVDPDTGDRPIISKGGAVGAGPGFGSAFGIAVESDGNFVVTDRGLFAVFRVDPGAGRVWNIYQFQVPCAG